MKEYEVYTAARDIQIFNGWNADGEENWTDCDHDLLLNVVWAKDEYDAVKKVAEKEGVSDTSRMYAVQHIVSGFVGEKRLEANSYFYDNLAGIHIELIAPGKEVQELNVELNTDSDILMPQTTEDHPMAQQKDKNFYLLHWNNEYLDLQICAGPGTKKAMQAAMKEHVVKRLVEEKITKSVKDASAYYDKVIDVIDEPYDLHVSENDASIDYGYEDRFQIVTY